MGLRQRATKDGEVFREHKHRAAIDRAPTCDNAIAGNFGFLHPEIGGAVLNEHIEFFERAMIHQKLDPLACREFATRVLGINAGLATAEAGLGAAIIELFENVFHGKFLQATL